VVITNEGNLEEVKARVKELWAKIHAPDRKKVKQRRSRPKTRL
jgi:hypothetical protein